MLELLHWKPVSHSAKVLICLHETGVEFESRFVDLLAFEQFADAFLDLNPLGQVPVLRVDGEVLSESSLINEYLAESYPDAGLAPTDPLGWYQCQAWSKFIDYNLSSAAATLGCQKYLAPLLARRERGALLASIEAIPVAERRAGWRDAARNAYGDDVIANSERKVRLVLERMESVLDDAKWLVAGRYSIADINTFAMLDTLRDIVPQLVNRDVAPKSMQWLQRIAARPAVAAALSGYGEVAGFAPGPEHSRWG
jgi:GSH-dependent disulfide-bond oxidoreductase